MTGPGSGKAKRVCLLNCRSISPPGPLVKRLLTTLVAITTVALSSCSGEKVAVRPPQLTMDQIAESYVRQVLAIGEHDPDFVDAYYGPAEWREQAKTAKRSLLDVRNVLARLYADVDSAPADPSVPPELWELRRRYLKNQLGALEARARMLEGWKPGFDDESLALFDVSAPFWGREDFKPMLDDLDRLLPKEAGTVSERYNRYLERYAIPPAKIEAVMRIAIEAARKRTLEFFRLPEGERFELSLVKDKPWSAYNWYQGNFVSRIEVNTDQPLTVSRAIELASHEGYPGHHVYNVLLEDQMLRTRGWKEFSVYALFSPQSFIAEGSADYGVDLAFPKPARIALLRQLFMAAGLPIDEAETYDAVVEAARMTGAATIEAARRYRDGQASAEETQQWLQAYALSTPERAKQRLQFIDRYGAYIINYHHGETVIADYVERATGPSEPYYTRWRTFFDLLSTPRTPQGLLPKD